MQNCVENNELWIIHSIWMIQTDHGTNTWNEKYKGKRNGKWKKSYVSVQYQVFHVRSNQLETKYALKICGEFKRNEWSSSTESDRVHELNEWVNNNCNVFIPNICRKRERKKNGSSIQVVSFAFICFQFNGHHVLISVILLANVL